MVVSPPPAPFRARDATALDRKDRLLVVRMDRALGALDASIPGDPADVCHALHYVHSRIGDPGLSAADVHAAVASSRLRVHLRRAIGLGVRAYIERARLFVAARLLASPDLELYLIADAVGYEQYETFCRAFKRTFEVPPSAYRLEVLWGPLDHSTE